MSDKEWEALVLKVNDEDIGYFAYILQGGFTVAKISAPGMMGSDEDLRDEAFKIAEHIADLHNKSLKG
jgi:hypothetical protein